MSRFDELTEITAQIVESVKDQIGHLDTLEEYKVLSAVILELREMTTYDMEQAQGPDWGPYGY